MAVEYPTYPVTTLAQAEDMLIFTGNQMHDVMNADSTSVIEAEDGHIPSIRKALVDNMYFKTPQDWVSGTQVTDPLQLKRFTDGGWYFSPTATASTPVNLGATPIGDTNWKPWSKDQGAVYQHAKRLAAEAGYNMVSGSFYFGGVIDSADDVLFYEGDGKYYSWSGAFPKVIAAGSSPTPVSAGNWVDRTDDRLRSDINIVQKVFSSISLAKIDESLYVGQIIETIGYHDGWAATVDGPKGGNRYEVVASGTGVDDGGSFIDLTGSGHQAKGLFVDGKHTAYRFGARGATGYDDASPLQKLINFSNNPLIEKGRYHTTATIIPKSNQAIEFEADAELVALTNYMTVLKATTETELSLVNPKINDNGLISVVGIEFDGVQYGSKITNPKTIGCLTGIKLSNTYGVTISCPFSYKTKNPITLVSSNGNTIEYPELLNTSVIGGSVDGTGIDIQSGTANIVVGGYIQGFTNGYRDAGESNNIKGTYFEDCSDSHIFADGNTLGSARDTFHYGISSNSAIKGRYSQGYNVDNPTLAPYSPPTLGMFDVDSSNTNFKVRLNASTGYNAPLGNVTGIKFLQEQGGETTVNVFGETTAGTCSYLYNKLQWKQVENIIYFTLAVVWSGHTGSGNLLLSGFPKDASSGFNLTAFAVNLSGNPLPADTSHCTGTMNTSYTARIDCVSDSGVLTKAQINGSGGTLNMQGFYFV